MINKVTSPQGEEFVLADESVNRVLVKGVTAVLRARTEQLWSTKEGDMFLFADAEGNLVPEKGVGAGLYYRDCRFLSDLVMRVDSRDPLLLSTSADRAYMSHIDVANQDLHSEGNGEVIALQGTVNIRRTRVINGRLYERIRIRSYNETPVDLTIELAFGTDFADIFEVRGLRRTVRGKLAVLPSTLGTAAFAYAGEDGVFRQTRITFELPPTQLAVDGDRVVASWRIHLERGEVEVIPFTVEPVIDGAAPAAKPFDAAVHERSQSS